MAYTMTTIKKILFVAHRDILFSDDPSFDKCLEATRKVSGKLTIIKVISDDDLPCTKALNSAEITDITSKIMEYNRILFSRIIDASDYGCDVDFHVCSGIDFIEIIKTAEQLGVDLIAKVEDFNQDYFSSSDFHLLRKASVPVWIMRNRHGRGYKRMLIAIDLALEADEEGRALNANIMRMADDFSEVFGFKQNVISCWKLYGESLLKNNPFIQLSDHKLKRILKFEEKSYNGSMNDFKVKYGCSGEYKLMQGDAKVIIPEHVKAEEFDLVLMGTVSRTGISGYIIGNTAESILQNIQSSVVAIKPNDFVSPVL